MLNRTRRIYIVGASHARKIGDAMQEIVRVKEYNLEIINMAVSGNIWINTEFPDYHTVSPQDIIIVQALGNDIFKKHVQRDLDGLLRMTKMIPFPGIDRKILALRLKLSQAPCKVLFIDCPYRHLKVQSLMYKYTELFAIQKRINRALKANLEDLDQVTFLSHLSLLNLPYRWVKRLSNYVMLVKDGVHFWPALYMNIAHMLLINQVGCRMRSTI